MCLGVPGKVISVQRDQSLLVGEVDFGGVRRSVCFEHVPDVNPGDHVLVHAGFALARIDEAEAQRLLRLLRAASEGRILE